MGFSVPTTLNLPPSTPVKMALFRQATYPLWADQIFTAETITGSWQTETLNYVANPAATITDISAPVTASVTAYSTGNRIASPTAVGVVGALAPATTAVYVPFGVDLGTGPNPFIYVPNGFYLYFVVTATSGVLTSTTNTVVTYERWSSPGEIGTLAQGLATNVAGQTGSMTSEVHFDTGAWIRPRGLQIELPASSSMAATSMTITAVVTAGFATYAGSIGNYGTVTIIGAVTTALYPLTYPVEFTNSTLPWYSTRVTASAFLGTNVTQIQKKGGTILAGRVAPSVQNPWEVSQSYVNGLHPAEKAFLPLETGVYSYCPPSTDLAAFWDYTLPTGIGSNSSKACPIMRLDNDSLVNIMYITATSDAEQLAITCDWHIEFRTSSALFPIGLSAMSLESLHTAQLALASIGFFFENPTHKTLLNKVVSAAKSFAPQAAGLLAGPTAARLVKGAIMLANKPRSDMKTTTAQSSGWNGPPKPAKGGGGHKQKKNKSKKAPIGPRRKNGKF